MNIEPRLGDHVKTPNMIYVSNFYISSPKIRVITWSKLLNANDWTEKQSDE